MRELGSFLMGVAALFLGGYLVMAAMATPYLGMVIAGIACLVVCGFLLWYATLIAGAFMVSTAGTFVAYGGGLLIALVVSPFYCAYRGVSSWRR